MRNVLIVLFVLVIAGGGYYTYWHKKADEFKEMFVQSTDALNANAKPLTKDAQLMRYESLSMTGFPFSMVLEINKPVITLPLSAFLAVQMPPSADTPKPASTPPEWVEEISYNDKMTLTGSIRGDYFTYTIYGDSTVKDTVDKTQRHAFTASYSAPTICHLGVEQPVGGAPWTMQPIFTDPKTFLTIFRAFDCTLKSFAVKDTAGAALYSGDGFALALHNEPSEGTNHKLAFATDLSKVVATPAFDAISKDYTTLFYQLAGRTDKARSTIAAYGEQNVRIDLRYDGPTEEKALSDPAMKLHVDINAFDLHNALFDVTMAGHLSDMPQGNDRAVSVSLHAKSNVTEQYDALMEKSLSDALVDVAAMPPTPTNNEVSNEAYAKMVQTLSGMGKPEEIATRIYPKLHLLGQNSLDVEVNVKGPNSNSFMRQNQLALDDLSWVSAPYGLKLKGSSNSAVQGKPPVADFTFTCLSCDALVSDAGDYALRLQSMLQPFTPNPQAPPTISKDLIDGIRQFLHGVAENSSAKDLVIHLALKDTGFTISGKQVPEVMALYMTTIAPRMPQPSPAAGGDEGMSSPEQ